MPDNLERQVGVLIGQVQGVHNRLDQIQRSQESIDTRLRRIEAVSGVVSTIAGACAGFASALIQGGGSGPQA